MKKLLIATSTVLLFCGQMGVKADNTTTQPSNVAPNATNSANPYEKSGTMNTPQSSQQAPANWKQLKGTVETKDATTNQVTLKDDSGSSMQVSVDENITIHKAGKNVALSDIQTGDRIVLINNHRDTTQNKS